MLASDTPGGTASILPSHGVALYLRAVAGVIRYGLSAAVVAGLEAGLVVLQPRRPAVSVDVTPAVYEFASRVRDGFLERDSVTATVALDGVPRLASRWGAILRLNVQLV